MYGRPIKARPLMAGQFRLGAISCCKPNPAIGGYTCYDANGTPVWNSGGHAGPIPNPCPDEADQASAPVGINPPAQIPSDNDCPLGQFRPAPGAPCRGSVGNMPGGGTDILPPAGGSQNIPPPPNGGNSAYPVQNCNVPQNSRPTPGGGVGIGGAVMACPRGDGTFDIFNYSTLAPMMSGISQECLNQFGDVTMKRADEYPCVPAQAPPPVASVVPPPPVTPPAVTAPTLPTTPLPPPQNVITNPGAAPLTYPIQNMWFPESLEPPPIQPVSGGPMAPFQPFPAPAYQPPPAPPPPPSRPLYAPGQPIPVIDWFGICIDKSRGR